MSAITTLIALRDRIEFAAQVFEPSKLAFECTQLVWRIEDRKQAIDYFLDPPDRNSEFTGQNLRAFAVFPARKNGRFDILIINRD